MAKHLLVGNPSAHSGRAAEAIASARVLLERLGHQVVVIATEPEGRTPGLVARAIAELSPDVVDCLGGDGTFNEVACGILTSGVPLPMGMLPMGTANDQGRSFGLEPGVAHVADHVDVIAAGHITRLDVGTIDALDADGATRARARFFDSASFGLAPDILSTRNRDREEVKRIPILAELYRDQAVYVGAAIDRILASFVEPTKFDCVAVTESWERTWLGLTDLVVKATPIFAGGWVLDRACEPDDGLFEIVPVQSRGEWLARIVGDLTHNPLPIAHEHIAARRFDLHFERPGDEAIASQIDGEEWVRGDHFRIEVQPNALSLITPAGFVGAWCAR